jgi:hypothetical protein
MTITLERALEKNPEFFNRLKKVNGVEEAVTLCQEYGVETSDLNIPTAPTPVDLSDQELEMALAGVSQGATRCGDCATVNSTACTNCG